LKEGDQVIVEGIQKARPGTPVTPEPWHPEPASAKPSPSTAGGR
jgi:membrane fusion protein (multidrug efflux system)